MPKLFRAALATLLITTAARAGDDLTARVIAAAGNVPRHTLTSRLTLRDYSHPKHLGDFREETFPAATFTADARRDLVAMQFGAEDRVVVRHFELLEWKDGKYAPGDAYGELTASMLTKLDPLAVVASLAAHRTNVHVLDGTTLLYAAGTQLWRIHVDPKTARITSIDAAVVNDTFGDATERVTYDGWAPRGGIVFPARITLAEGDRVRVAMDVTDVRAGGELPAIASEDRAIAEEDVTFKELAPHLYAIELAATQSRVFIAEFADFVFVIEGAFNSRNGDLLARRIEERFRKPVRYFSFSHIHGQYAGSARSFAAAGATIETTKSGAEVVKTMLASPRRFAPDAWSNATATPKIDAIEKTKRIADDVNEVVMYNVESEHTDDYFIFYLPKQKVVISGDLLCYRGPTAPLKSRSQRFVKDVQELQLDVERVFPSWPIEGYGCAPVVPWEAVAAVR